MTLEALLASLHLLAVLTLVVFLSSQAALCRAEWLNAAVIERLVRLDQICRVVMLAVLVTGLVRVFWGIKGQSWYASQPLLHLKGTLWVAVWLLSVPSARAFRRWRGQWHQCSVLPPAAEIQKARWWVMVQAHLLPIVAVLAVFWARGW